MIGGPQSPSRLAEYQILASKSGEGFDRAYIRQQVAAHICAVALYEAESEMGRDEHIRALASDTLPKLRQHLQMARQLMGPEDESVQATGLETREQSPSRPAPARAGSSIQETTKDGNVPEETSKSRSH
jgi:hypothetical protein